MWLKYFFIVYKNGKRKLFVSSAFTSPVWYSTMSSSVWPIFHLSRECLKQVSSYGASAPHALLGLLWRIHTSANSYLFCEFWTNWGASDVPFQTCLFLVSYHLLIVLKAPLQNACTVISGWLTTTKRFEATA